MIALKQLVKFSPFIAGDTFTQADCSAFAMFPVVAMATKAVFGEDLLLAGGLDYKPYVKHIAERASAQRVNADMKAAMLARKPA
jgi:glutathione S-transferase